MLPCTGRKVLIEIADFTKSELKASFIHSVDPYLSHLVLLSEVIHYAVAVR
jgi:hypothetical protein